MSPRRLIVIGIAVLVLCACPLGTLVAQTTWMHPPIEQGVALEFTKAKFNEEPELKFWTSTAFLYGKWKMSHQLTFLFELPIANADYYFPGNVFWGAPPFKYRATAMGNPYLGLELVEDGSAFTAELGIRPPMVGDPENEGDAMPLEVGYFMAYDRFEAFIPKLTSLNANFGYRGVYPSGNIKSTFRLLAGATTMIPDEGDAELFVDGFADYWMRSPGFAVGFGLTGRYLLTESELDFNERTVFQVRSAAQVGFGKFHPGIHFQIPLDNDLNDLVNIMFGIDLVLDLSRPETSDLSGESFH